MNYLFSICLTLVVLITDLQAQKIGDDGDGSRGVPVHRIKLIDNDSSVVRLDDQPLLPFSTRNTCGECHDYQKIKQGWHFNAGDTTADKGRPGHPWIYFDRMNLVQVPLSLRGWPGTFTPSQIGIDPIQFISLFGGYFPGGEIGEEEAMRNIDNYFRWQVSGSLEINCLTCHDAEFMHDRADYVSQVARQNFRWAATASSAIAEVRGSARDMPDNYDIYMGRSPDQPQKIAPQVIYQSQRFNERHEVYFDVVRKIPNSNCYFCHSSAGIGSEIKPRWQSTEDVHLMSGMNCVDCHRHGLDHMMVRGYKGESQQEASIKNGFSCAGCHLRVDDPEVPLAGRGGAPFPEHKGLPAVHFEKLSCTACHSGAWPRATAGLIKTSMAHRLGAHGINKSARALPHILSPVFVQGTNGQIIPHNQIWPTYWTVVSADSLIPLTLEEIDHIPSSFLVNDDTTGHGNWLTVSDTLIYLILDSLRTIFPTVPDIGLVTAGELLLQGSDSTIIRGPNDLLKPYSWPLAHDVRPAAQSLGINGCADCHSTNSPVYFGAVSLEGPLRPERATARSMIDFQDNNTVSVWVFSLSFLFRPWLKWLIVLCCLIISAVIVLYAFRGLAKILESIATERK